VFNKRNDDKTEIHPTLPMDITMKNLIFILLIMSFTACASTSNSPKKTTILSESIGKNIATIYDYYQKNQYKKALVLANELTPKTDYDRAYVSKLIGMIHLANGESDKAISSLKAAVDVNLLSSTVQSHALKTLGDIYLAEGNIEQAQIYLKKATAL
jgi:tetratricopeptide (TPR) repeat protein